MYSILEEFFYGGIARQAQAYKSEPEYKEITAILSSLEQDIASQLSAGEKNLFEKYIHAQEERNQLSIIQGQIYGYKLGALMTAETFVTGGELIIKG